MQNNSCLNYMSSTWPTPNASQLHLVQSEVPEKPQKVTPEREIHPDEWTCDSEWSSTELPLCPVQISTWRTVTLGQKRKRRGSLPFQFKDNGNHNSFLQHVSASWLEEWSSWNLNQRKRICQYKPHKKGKYGLLNLLALVWCYSSVLLKFCCSHTLCGQEIIFF